MTSIKLSSQLVLLVAFLAIVSISLPALTHADTLNRELQVGMSGNDVSALQSFLAQDSTIYPEGLVTGYYGPLTKAAVARWQTKNGISAVGRVGPATLPVINQHMAGTTNDPYAPIISGVSVSASRNSVTVHWKTNESSKGVVYYSPNPLSMYENGNAPIISGTTISTDTSLHDTHGVSVVNLQPNTTYYYLVHSTDQAGNVSVTWPAVFQTAN